jgi:hypothetical protein
MHRKFWTEPKGRDSMEELGIDWNIILKWMWGVSVWSASYRLRIETSA